MKRKKTASKKQSPSPTPPSPSTSHLQEFQKAYGAQWLTIIQSAPFREAMYLLNKRKTDALPNLTDENIATLGPVILADLRGHFRHENDLMTLHVQSEESLIDEPEDYFSPTQIAEFELLKDRFRSENEKSRYT